MIADILNTLLAKRDLSADEATTLMRTIVAGQVSPVSIAALAVALRAKGESVEELAAFAHVMRDESVRVDAPAGALDTCGTGGDGGDTFNISTAAAFVAAGMGIPIAKHGGKSSSSKSGSADVLKALGVNIECDAARVAHCIRTAGVGFMFAPSHHPGMKHAATVRRELGIRTIFNLLGPLSNPAHARLQLLGVSQPELCEKFAEVLRRLGSVSAMVVCGAGSTAGSCLDELSTFGPSTVTRLHQGRIQTERVDAAEWSLPRPAPGALHAADAAASAAMIREIFNGRPGAPRDIVVLNAAGAAIVAGLAADWSGAIELARTCIDGGRAQAALNALVKESNA